MLGALRKETPVFVVTKVYPNHISEIKKIFITRERAFEYADQQPKEGTRYIVDRISLEE